MTHLVTRLHGVTATHQRINTDMAIKRGGGYQTGVAWTPLDVKAPLVVGGHLIHYLDNSAVERKERLCVWVKEVRVTSVHDGVNTNVGSEIVMATKTNDWWVNLKEFVRVKASCKSEHKQDYLQQMCEWLVIMHGCEVWCLRKSEMYTSKRTERCRGKAV